MTAYSVMDVANFFIDYFKKSVDPMTVPRLQLFVYYAQAECLARYNRTLFADEIRAYATGPAVTRIYAYFDGAGNEQITSTYGSYSVSKFDEIDRNLLLDVAVFYNQFSTGQLQIMSYHTGGPWAETYGVYGDKLAAIDPSVIKEFFLLRPRVPSHMDFMLATIEMSKHNDAVVVGAGAVVDNQIYPAGSLTSSWE